LCDVPASTRELMDFKVFQELGKIGLRLRQYVITESIRDLNVSLNLRSVDDLTLFEFCGMQNCGMRKNSKV